jgi:hypothetical protein
VGHLVQLVVDEGEQPFSRLLIALAMSVQKARYLSFVCGHRIAGGENDYSEEYKPPASMQTPVNLSLLRPEDTVFRMLLREWRPVDRAITDPTARMHWIRVQYPALNHPMRDFATATHVDKSSCKTEPVVR